MTRQEWERVARANVYQFDNDRLRPMTDDEWSRWLASFRDLSMYYSKGR